ncbi:hypothetical protein U1Q18_009759, partial [Sarracenia purpurea var. burkii]
IDPDSQHNTEPSKRGSLSSGRDDGRTPRWWRRLLPADGSVPVGADAAGSTYHPHRICPPDDLLPW